MSRLFIGQKNEKWTNLPWRRTCQRVTSCWSRTACCLETPGYRHRTRVVRSCSNDDQRWKIRQWPWAQRPTFADSRHKNQLHYCPSLPGWNWSAQGHGRHLPQPWHPKGLRAEVILAMGKTVVEKLLTWSTKMALIDLSLLHLWNEKSSYRSWL